MTYEQRKEVLLKAAQVLTEHFEVGTLQVSWHEGGTTFYLQKGFGNEFAREGMARGYVEGEILDEEEEVEIFEALDEDEE